MPIGSIMLPCFYTFYPQQLQQQVKRVKRHIESGDNDLRHMKKRCGSRMYAQHTRNIRNSKTCYNPSFECYPIRVD